MKRVHVPELGPDFVWEKPEGLDSGRGPGEMHYKSVVNDERHLDQHHRRPANGQRQPIESARGVSDLLKRAMDLTIAIPMAIFLLPAFALLAAIVWFDDRGPIIFRQIRRGRDGRAFVCFKYRTMVIDAAARLEHLLENCPDMREEWEASQKLKTDPRLTGVGGFLRRYSLDELPQLWNIIKGEMSIVGPRPIIPDEVVRYGDDIDAYDAVRPGVVGLWQISGRNDTSYDERVALDVTYASNRSLLMDISILLRSIPAILLKRGAY